MSSESHFPRHYRMSAGWRLFFLFGGLPLLAAGIWLSLGMPGGGEPIGAARWIAGAVLGLPSVLIGGWSVLAPFRPALVLHRDALEFPGVFRSTVLPRVRIVGRRAGKGGSSLHLVEMRPAGGERLRQFMLTFAPDPALMEWMATLPDLDAPDLAASQRQVDADPRLGDTVEARRDAMSRAVRAGQWLSFGMVGLLFWAIAFPRPYLPLMALLAALPWFVLFLCHRWPAAYSVADSGRKDQRVDLISVVFAPGMILMLRALYDVALVDLAEAVVPALVVLATFLAALATIEPAYRRAGKLALIAALMSAYAVGVVCVGNVLFDHSKPAWHRVTVNAKHVTTGKNPRNVLAIDRWPDAAVDEVKVTRSLFDATKLGDAVCVAVRGGAVGIRWYEVYGAGACAEAGS